MVDVNVLLDPRILSLTLILSLLAFINKAFGAAMPAILKLRDMRSSVCLGIGMTPRGEMELVIATTALEMKAVGERVYAQIVGMVLITTFIAPLVMTKYCIQGKCNTARECNK